MLIIAYKWITGSSKDCLQLNIDIHFIVYKTIFVPCYEKYILYVASTQIFNLHQIMKIIVLPLN